MIKLFIIIVIFSFSTLYSCKKCKNCKIVMTNTETGVVLSETKTEEYCDEDLQDIEKEKPTINGNERIENVCE